MSGGRVESLTDGLTGIWLVGWLVEVKRVKCEWNAIDLLGIL